MVPTVRQFYCIYFYFITFVWLCVCVSVCVCLYRHNRHPSGGNGRPAGNREEAARDAIAPAAPAGCADPKGFFRLNHGRDWTVT